MKLFNKQTLFFSNPDNNVMSDSDNEQKFVAFDKNRK